MNKIIKTLIFSDFILNSGWGILAPIFSIFILENIALSDPAQGLKIAGFTALVYWTVKSILQIPIGRYLDKNHGEKDDFWFAVIGSILAGIAPLGFIFSSQPWHIYIFYAIHASGMAMLVPSWFAIFTRHIDKGKEAFEWGARSTILGFGVGVTGALGGMIAAAFGFNVILIIVGSFTIASGFLMFLVRKELIPHGKTAPHPPRFTPHF